MTPEWRTQHGRQPADDEMVFLGRVGSTVHGLELAGTDDEDRMGIFVPPPHLVLGVHRVPESATARTAAEGERSGPDDIDVVSYPLQKWARLASDGNPTVLLPLFLPAEHVIVTSPLADVIRASPELFLSKQTGQKFLGYLLGQREHMVTGQRTPNRPELIAAHGYDTKYAGHALRLGLQGVELFTTGRLTLPMSGADRDMVLAVRRGEVGEAEALQLIDRQAEVLEATVARSTAFPERVDRTELSKTVADWHLQWWLR